MVFHFSRSPPFVPDGTREDGVSRRTVGEGGKGRYLVLEGNSDNGSSTDSYGCTRIFLLSDTLCTGIMNDWYRIHF